jgi:serine/threonine protein kinase
MDDLSKYHANYPAESLEDYAPGGLHPVHINDYYKDGRYQILNKLGWGSYSTVWAAQDHQ